VDGRDKPGHDECREAHVSLAVTVRPVRPGDFDQWLPLWEGYNAFYGRAGATALAAEITQATWARFFESREPVHALVADSEGRLTGLAHYLFHRSTILLAPTCYLQDLFTDATQRRNGVGRALIDAVYDAARAAGSSRVYWHTHATNQTARKLYDQLAEDSGFIVYRRQV
jgi:GNAT superfamily N-acetyltransferase